MHLSALSAEDMQWNPLGAETTPTKETGSVHRFISAAALKCSAAFSSNRVVCGRQHDISAAWLGRMAQPAGVTPLLVISPD